MAVDLTNRVTLRSSRSEFTLLGWAFAVSLAAHLLFWGAFAAAKHFDLAHKLKLPQWAQNMISPPPPPPPPAEREPYIFVDVREVQSVAEPPKNAIRYSDRNAVAANPTEDQNSNQPKLDGENPDSQQTEDGSRRNRFDQLMPDPPKPVEPVPPKITPNAMTVANAEIQRAQEQPRTRPRTIREAMLQKQQPPGARAKLEGGASLRAQASYDVKATGFGAYDRAFIDAVSSRWYDLLDNMSYDGYRQGKVVVQFVLNYDGRITEMKVVSNTVTETLSLLCQKAVLDPAPFEKWPREMRLMVGEDSRRITFTFNYN
jgi:outer membrane biosynthesis protein TonB